MDFIKDYELNEMFSLTELSEEEILEDFKIYLKAMDMEPNRIAWFEYMEDTRNYF